MPWYSDDFVSRLMTSLAPATTALSQMTPPLLGGLGDSYDALASMPPMLGSSDFPSFERSDWPPFTLGVAEWPVRTPDRQDAASDPLAAGLARYRARQSSPASATTPSSPFTDTGSYTAGDLPGVSDNVLRWYPLAKKYADQEGVPVEAVLAIIANESGGDPQAQSGVNSGGQGRAQGLMQMLPLYHAKDGANLFDPETNIARGTRYFAQAYKNRGSLDKAMAEYFGGGGAFDAAGNIIRDRGDMNITIGKYIDTKFNPAVNAYRQWVNQRGQSAANATTSQGAGPNTSALAAAVAAIGTPYVWGGANEQGFDCSGLIQWAFYKAGKTIPRTAQQQWSASRRLTPEELQPGDLVFYANTYKDDPNEPITHVAMYAGNGQVVMAPSEGSTVRRVALNDPYWRRHLAGFGRV